MTTLIKNSIIFKLSMSIKILKINQSPIYYNLFDRMTFGHLFEYKNRTSNFYNDTGNR